MKRTKISHLLQAQDPAAEVLIKGWVRTRRDSRDFSFIEVNDGSCLKNMQVIGGSMLNNYNEVAKLTTGSAVAVKGKLAASQGAGQRWEIQADQVDVLSLAPESFPLQK